MNDMVTRSMPTVQDWLSHNPHLPLKRAPDEWDGCAFFQVTSDRGLITVLAPNHDYAERAAVRHLGTGGLVSVDPVPRQWPHSGMGWQQYIDGVLVLEGDPSKPALRGPDSSPALDRELAFMDALHGDPAAQMRADRSWRGDRFDRANEVLSGRWERMHDARLRHLRSCGAVSEDGATMEWDGERWRMT